MGISDGSQTPTGPEAGAERVRQVKEGLKRVSPSPGGDGEGWVVLKTRTGVLVTHREFQSRLEQRTGEG